jgi:hypothetical protein
MVVRLGRIVLIPMNLFNRNCSFIVSLVASVGGSIIIGSLYPSPSRAQTVRNACYSFGGRRGAPENRIAFFAFEMRTPLSWDPSQDPSGLYRFVDEKAYRLGFSPSDCQRSITNGAEIRFKMDNASKNPPESYVVGWLSSGGRLGFAVISGCENTYVGRNGYCVAVPGKPYTLVSNGNSWSTDWWSEEGTFGQTIRFRFTNPPNTGRYTSDDIIYSIGFQVYAE